MKKIKGDEYTKEVVNEEMKALGVDHNHRHNVDCKHPLELSNEDSMSLISRKNLNYFFVDMAHQKGYKDLHENNEIHAGLGKTIVEVLNTLQE